MEISTDPKEVVLQFNQCINSGDLAGRAKLLAPEHRFIDSSDELRKGKEVMVEGWRQFFQAYPDYRNHIGAWIHRQNTVVLQGYSTSVEPELDGPALWQAVVDAGLVLEWRVFLDSPENHQFLGITPAGRPRPMERND